MMASTELMWADTELKRASTELMRTHTELMRALTDLMRARTELMRARAERMRASMELGKKSSNAIALPHPQSGNDKHWKENVPRRRGVIWNVFKRAIDVAHDRNAEDQMNRAKN